MTEIQQARHEVNRKDDATPQTSHAYDEIHAAWRSGNSEKRFGTNNSDKTSGAEPTGVIQPDGSKLYSLKLDHKSSNHAGPDAMVLLPKDYDQSKPVHLVVYNHGWNDTVSSAVKHADLVKQMENAPPNSVLVVPEWQQIPGSGLYKKLGGKQGNFANPGTFDGMIDDVFKKVPELRDNSFGQDPNSSASDRKVKGEPISQSTLNKIGDISIISHSAGYNAVGSEIYKNDALEKKVSSITMLDSVYKSDQFQPWLKKHKAELESGEKRFTNIYGKSSQNESAILEKDAERILPSLSITYDSSSGSKVVTPTDLVEKPVVFRKTNYEHPDIPKVYVGVELSAEAQLTKLKQ